VTKLSKEKTAKIIPNAVGLCTEEGKHIFASLLSRDTTFKLMNKLWTRAMRELPPDLMLRTVVKQIIKNTCFLNDILWINVMMDRVDH
jgi:hypothetical protein